MISYNSLKKNLRYFFKRSFFHSLNGKKGRGSVCMPKGGCVMQEGVCVKHTLMSAWHTLLRACTHSQDLFLHWGSEKLDHFKKVEKRFLFRDLYVSLWPTSLVSWIHFTLSLSLSRPPPPLLLPVISCLLLMLKNSFWAPSSSPLPLSLSLSLSLPSSLLLMLNSFFAPSPLSLSL